MWHIRTYIYIHTYNGIYRAAFKEILTHAAAWMNLGDNVLSEINPDTKDKHSTIPVTRGTQSSQIHRQKVPTVVASGGEGKSGRIAFPRDRVSVSQVRESGGGWW